MHLYYQEEHHTYLLSAWKETADSEWRFMLKDVDTREQHYFANLEHLLADLRAQFAGQVGTDESG